MDLSKKVKIFRVENNLTQKGLADKLGKTAAYVSLLERGGRAPGLKQLQELVNINVITPDEATELIRERISENYAKKACNAN